MVWIDKGLKKTMGSYCLQPDCVEGNHV